MVSLWLTLVAGASAVWSPEPEEWHIPVSSQSGVSQVSLYPPDGPVDVWEAADLQSVGQESNPGSISIAALYLDWCPHCQRLVPEWTALADAFKGVHGIKVAAINCADQVNSEECEKLNVAGFPSIMCFGCKPNNKECKENPCEITDGYAFTGTTTFSDNVLGWLSNVTHGELKPAHPVRHVQPHFKKVVVIGAPGKPGWIPSMLTSPDKHSVDAARALLSVIWTMNDKAMATSAMHFVLKLFGDKGDLCAYSFLSNWDGAGLTKLSNSLGGATASGVRKIVHDYADDHYVHGLQAPTFPKFTNDMLEQGAPTTSYQACLTHTCPIWTFLHVATSVAAVLGEQGDLRGKATSGDVLQFVREFVSSFLQCRECRTHFLTRFDSCAFGRCDVGNATDWQGVVLWLWRAHNAVSMRVAAEQNNNDDRRWPSFEDCPTCWKPSQASEMQQPAVAGDDVDQHMVKFDKMFNIQEVYHFILLSYLGEKNVASCPPPQLWQLVNTMRKSPTAQLLSVFLCAAGAAVLVMVACGAVRRASKRGDSKDHEDEMLLNGVE